MELIKNIFLVIISPKVGWEEVNRSGASTNAVLARMFYPMLGILAVTSFVPMIYDKTITLVASIIYAIAQVAIYFFDYFITNFLVTGFYPELVKTKAGHGRVNDYIIYSLSYLVILNIISNLLPIDFAPVLIMMMYVLWICTQGVEYVGLEKKKEMKFIFITSIMMLIAPVLIIILFNK